MATYKIFQLDLLPVRDQINQLGWEAAINEIPAVRVKFTQPENLSAKDVNEHYTLVSEIEADDLEHVFEVGNIGPQDRITKIHSRVASVSVGDIIHNPETGEWHVVSPIGFTDITETMAKVGA